MSQTNLLRRIGNSIYHNAFPLYLPLYSAFKSIGDNGERQLLARYLGSGMTVVDAGANIGIYSRFLAGLVTARGKVHSFEPSPENFRRLKGVVSKYSNIVLNQAAVGSKSGEIELYASDELNVDHRTYPVEGGDRKVVKIDCVALDDYFAPGTKIDLIKMDIQGFELEALRGSTRVLRDNPKIKLLLEFWPFGLRSAGFEPASLLEFLQNDGFTIKRLAGRTLAPLEEECIRDENERTYCNIFVERL